MHVMAFDGPSCLVLKISRNVLWEGRGGGGGADFFLYHKEVYGSHNHSFGSTGYSGGSHLCFPPIFFILFFSNY